MDVKLVGAKCQHCGNQLDLSYDAIGYKTWGREVFFGETITEEMARLSGQMYHNPCMVKGLRGFLLELEPVQ